MHRHKNFAVIFFSLFTSKKPPYHTISITAEDV